MSFFQRSPREAQTTLACPNCQNPLMIKRSCHNAYMMCSACQKKYELEPFIAQMDDAMERFLEGVYMNRI